MLYSTACPWLIWLGASVRGNHTAQLSVRTPKLPVHRLPHFMLNQLVLPPVALATACLCLYPSSQCVTQRSVQGIALHGHPALSCSAVCEPAAVNGSLFTCFSQPHCRAAGASAAQLWCCLQLHEGGGEQAVQVICHQSAAVPTPWGKPHVALQHLPAHFCRLWAPATQGDLALSLL